MDQQLQVIGRLERIAFPEWNFFDIEAKIDTGAYTSSIHCHEIEEVGGNGDSPRVRFRLLDPSHEEYRERFIELPVFRQKTVKSSNGTAEKRIFIKTAIQLAERTISTEFSLTDRSGMRHPVLLGRKLLKGSFLVDVSRTNLLTPTSENSRP